MLIILILILIHLCIVAINTLLIKLLFVKNIPELSYYSEEDIIWLFFIVWCPITNILWLLTLPVIYLIGRFFIFVKSFLTDYIEWLTK